MLSSFSRLVKRSTTTATSYIRVSSNIRNYSNAYYEQYYNKHNNYYNTTSTTVGLTLAMSTALGLSLSTYKTHKNGEACGIMGMISAEEQVVDYLLEGLSILQNRGYDSAGIATINNKENSVVKCTKYASTDNSTSDSLDLLSEKSPINHAFDRCGIAHTRWATHGSKTDINAHPHCDYKKRIAIVHNGTISNCITIKNELISNGITFKSETDTEVIANLIGYYLDQSKNDLEIAFELALNRLEGSWGIAMISNNNSSKIYAARNGSPLMIGIDSKNNRNFIASEHSAFAKYTRDYISLNEGERAIITANNICNNNGNININNRIKKIKYFNGNDYISTPEPYNTWTEKEIMEQPEAISNALQHGARLNAFKDEVILSDAFKDGNDPQLKNIKNLIITGCGTSLNAALYGKRLMEYLSSFDTISVIDSGEIISDTFPTGSTKDNTGMLAISQSGETKDVLNALEMANDFNIPQLSVVNTVGSAIARQCCKSVGTIYCYAGRENAVASTKAFTSQVTILSLISTWFSQQRERNVTNKRVKILLNSLHKLHTKCGAVLFNTRSKCMEISKFITNEINARHIFVLGKGFSECIAYEGALKIKEITYIHAEGYSGGALKHGPFALIDETVPVIMIILDDEHKDVMITNAHEIEARNGKMIYITDNKKLLNGLKQQENIIEIPKNGPLTALLAVIPLQLIAYYIAINKGINPDKPRNLAKAVTVV